ncbi:amidohydrolase family protein [Neopusillimonas maritima]|jgi:imidazolonepropionase-like amidohydrolase|uniref:Amidohydrolase-related domain-containing protein n=1 Tax=Neopusillimonas maritima TaxID=2026239 RepID=A0ABX9MV93_9BURK|nr:amidohydrolase family protein [Neopusillimonas maritima]RII82024.1 hypothetical protein CJO09_13560 [Neopusillimonas maritima]
MTLGKLRQAYTGARIIDGMGAAFSGYMVVENGRIIDVQKGTLPDAVRMDAQTQVVELGEYTILPGMIDCHVHLTMDATPQVGPISTDEEKMLAFLRASRNALRTLHGGVTTVRDCGTQGNVDFALRRAASEGLCVTPRLLLSGEALCMTGGHGWRFLGQEVDGVDGVRKAARQRLKAGADNVKLIATGGILTPGGAIGNAQMTVDEMRAATDEAHNAGKISAAHAHAAQGIKNAVLANVDSIEHGYFIDPEGIDLMLRHGTWLVATSTPIRNVVTHGLAGGLSQDMVDKAQSAIDAHVSSFKQARAAGVKLAMGTDAGVPYTPHGSNLDELVYFVEMGMTPMEAIQVTTRDSARMLKMDHLVGTLEVGKCADFIVVEGDPLVNISILRAPAAIRKVVLNGRLVMDRDASQFLVGAAFGDQAVIGSRFFDA